MRSGSCLILYRFTGKYLTHAGYGGEYPAAFRYHCFRIRLVDPIHVVDDEMLYGQPRTAV